MYRLFLGNVSALSAGDLPSALFSCAPQGAGQTRWLAGRALLSHAVSPLPEIIYSEQGKPAFSAGTPLWFNLSHSNDDIALLLSDEGEVGCDIEVVRQRDNWRALVSAVFSPGEQAEIEATPPGTADSCLLADLDTQRSHHQAVRRKRLANAQYRQHAALRAVGEPDSDRIAQPRGLHANTISFDHREHQPGSLVKSSPAGNRHQTARSRSAVNTAPPERFNANHQPRHTSRRRCCASVRATGQQPAQLRSPSGAAPPGRNSDISQAN
ncbi:4'-phosphopantetheinyl transferase [Klebsiella michiganensis]|nr:4'-phosphopantetheinyl transferase [Klebsiella michiganensis]